MNHVLSSRENVGLNLIETIAMLDRAYWQFDKPLMYVAYSGGGDSALTLDVAKRWGELRGIEVRAMAIDTGLAPDGWREMVQRHCDIVEIQLEIVTGDGFEWYRSNVAQYGFGYTPNAHTVYYRKLKQSAIQSHLQSVKRHYHDRVAYIVGVRRAESFRRSQTKAWLRHGSRVTVNAIAHWGNVSKLNYLNTVAKWWANPYYATLGNSGDCQCGWVCKNKLSDLKSYPDLHSKIAECESLSLLSGLNKYGERMDSENFRASKMPDDGLCSNCMTQPRLL